MAAELVHHALLALSLVALGAAALRLASMAGAVGLTCALAAAPLAVSAAVIQALVLGLVGLGTSPVALSAAAALTWLLAWRLLPGTRPRLADELRRWWDGLGARGRLLAGAGLGAGLAWSVWYVRHPEIGADGLTYHLPEVAAWIEGGRPGSIPLVLHDIPVGNYPVTNEVALAWLGGIARSLVPISLWTMPLMLALAAVGAWQGLRSLGVPALAAVLATVGVCASPVLLVQLGGPNTELPAVAWTVCTATLSAASLRRPALLAPALVAGGLALGTKTTTVLPVAMALVGAAWLNRQALRQLLWPLTLAAMAALAAGGVWYLRNLVHHGSPLWPFVEAPWGDARPPVFGLVDGRLISDPLATVRGRGSQYFDALGGWTVLFVGALAAPLVARRREVTVATAATLLALLAWSASPFTGFPSGPEWTPLAIGATRYLAPTAVLAALALALAARGGGWRARAVASVLALAAATNLARATDIGTPAMPTLRALIAGALAGAVGAVLLSMALKRVRLRPLALLFAPGAAVLASVPVALSADGYVDRHVATRRTPPAIAWIVSQPGFQTGNGPIAMAPHLSGILAGGRFQHRHELIPLDEPCARTRARVRRGVVVIDRTRPGPPFSALRRRRFPSEKQAARLSTCLSALELARREAGYDVYGVPR